MCTHCMPDMFRDDNECLHRWPGVRTAPPLKTSSNLCQSLFNPAHHTTSVSTLPLPLSPSFDAANHSNEPLQPIPPPRPRLHDAWALRRQHGQHGRALRQLWGRNGRRLSRRTNDGDGRTHDEWLPRHAHGGPRNARRLPVSSQHGRNNSTRNPCTRTATCSRNCAASSSTRSLG